ncbi:MAG TPA: AMP-binding protein, partial [Mucilaginibacter sp.]|nr:AMP-binding protein [Mucilaginibacter sp.]
MDPATGKKKPAHRNVSLVHELFELQKIKTPDGLAVIFGDKRLTYSQLSQKADELASAIYSASPGSLIAGVSTHRSIETIVSVLAILKSGKAYMPLDPEYPQERLQQIVSDSGIDLFLAVSAQKQLFEPLGINVLASDKA